MMNLKQGQMTVEQNKAMVTRFFEEALDKENVGLIDDMFIEDCLFHRGDLTEPARVYQDTFDCRKARSTLPRLPNDTSSDDWGKRFGRHPRDSRRYPPGPVSYTNRHIRCDRPAYRMDLASIFSVRAWQDLGNVGRPRRARV